MILKSNTIVDLEINSLEDLYKLKPLTEKLGNDKLAAELNDLSLKYM